MIHAELHSKCGDVRKHEDALTSTVFGILKYTSFRPVLKQFLAMARNVVTGTCYDPELLGDFLEFGFWKRLDPKNEIDLEVRNNKYRLGIEVKYHAEESGPGQLARYSDFVDHVIYITMDSTQPKISNANEKIYWVSWLNLHRVVHEHIKSVASIEKELLTDLLKYLENRNIRLFYGFNANCEIPRVPERFFWRDKIFSPKHVVPQFESPIYFKGVLK